MQVFRSISELQSFVEECKSNQKTIGFVPTMGALHKGHLSLVSEALKENDVVIASIYVNPTQFNNSADLEKYPRMVEDDLKMLESYNCTAVFVPETSDMYPDGAKPETFNFGSIDSGMEGKYRPGHFQGMATIVKRFLTITGCNCAYFGEKDFQQLVIIRELVRQENLQTKIIGCPTLREADGLAMSSRNLRLNAAQRTAAPVLYETLMQIKQRASEQKSVNRSISKAYERINAHPELAVEYIEVVNEETLEPIYEWNEATHARAFVAAYAGDVRLIDNIQLF